VEYQIDKSLMEVRNIGKRGKSMSRLNPVTSSKAQVND
jgi:hypothetical protein